MNAAASQARAYARGCASLMFPPRRSRRMRAALSLLVVLLLAGCAAPAASVPEATGDAATAGGDCLSSVAGLDLHAVTIPDLQRALDAGEVTSVQLVEAYLARIAAFEPAVNAVQVTHPEALAIAAQLDAERAAGNVRGPLHGIPVLLKDNIGTSDMPTTAGSLALAENVPPEDATVTARLREAGAIILGKAQLSEFANWVSLTMPSGYSSLGGQVVNAYTGGDPSGSSSGSGVAGSMALATITLGTETSGSILSPSIANSLVGVKPTMGLVSRAGIIPLAPSFDVPGPMGRNVVDAALVLDAIAGADERDPVTAAGPSPPASHAALLSPDALEGVRLGYASGGDDPMFQEAIATLEALGAEVVAFETNEIDSVSLSEIPLIFNEFKASLNHYLATEAGPDTRVATLDEIVLFNQQHPDEMKYGQDLLIASDAQPGVMATLDPLATPSVLLSRAAADRIFTENDLDAIVGRNAPFTSLGAAAGYPTVVVPMGYDEGQPVGLSFFGTAFQEPALLAYAYAYEQATHARVPPHTIRSEILDGVCGA